MIDLVTVTGRILPLLRDGDARRELEERRLFADIALRGLQLPETVLHAFLLPAACADDEPAWATVMGQEAVRLRSIALTVQEDEAMLHTLGGITDPLDARKALVSLVLVDTLFAIQTSRLPANALRRRRADWIAMADNFGLWKLRYRLEDANFECLDPAHYSLMASLLEKQTRLHAQRFGAITAILEHHLRREGLRDFEITYRTKNIFGVFQKMQGNGKSINHIADLFGFRIVTVSPEDCYRALNVLHRLWPPFPDRLRDYIASPKPNGYRCIHSTVSCLEKTVVEFQIRTRAMDSVAKFGPAGHAEYKRTSRPQLVLES